jgi:inosose dehydratase
MRRQLNRRDFTKALTAGLGALAVAPLWAHGRRQLKIGHTGITWGFSPDDAEGAVRDVANLGYHAYESFGNVLEAWEDRGGFEQLLPTVEQARHKPEKPGKQQKPPDT